MTRKRVRPVDWRHWVVAGVGLAVCWGSAAPHPALADDDDLDLEAYDVLPPNEAWRESIGLESLEAGVDGEDIRVAVLDTGISQVTDLGDRVVSRVDLSPEGDGWDRYGHGTHMIGLVAGDGTISDGRWRGVAPEAEVVSVKVAGWNGATDVSMVLAGLEWVAANAPRLGIRVVNVSFGTDSSQKYSFDPLNHAVERLWRAGILVVASAGNRGPGGAKIDKPGDDPFVVTVGAADIRGTASRTDDVVAPFSSHGPTGDNVAKPDLVAPGISLVSHRAVGSTIDQRRPAARVDDDYFKGTGTSQAAAVVSGVAALMFEADPSLTPDEAKAVLVGTAAPMVGQGGAGAGLVDAAAAVAAVESDAFGGRPSNVGIVQATGLGSIDGSRGSYKPYTDLDGDGNAEQVSGEIDALGGPWDASSWAQQPWSVQTWAASPWAPFTVETPGWSVSGAPVGWWSGLGWDAESWVAKYWRDDAVDPDTWVAKYWRANVWA